MVALLAGLAALTGTASAPRSDRMAVAAVVAAASADADEDWTASGVDLVVHLRRQGGAWSGTMDSPANGVSGAPLSQVVLTPQRLSFAIGKGGFDGSWDSKKQAYAGLFRMGAQGSFPLSFTRGTLTTFGFEAPADPALSYTPGPPAKARVGPALPIGKCLNLSNTLDAPNEGDWAPPVAEDDFRIIRAAGFSTVRIPIRWSAHTAHASPFQIDPDFLARVHHVVDLAMAAHLNAILDLHHYDELAIHPEANRERFTSIWRQIAQSFAAAPPNLWFELDNEPHGKLTNARLAFLLEPALRAVRATNPTRPVLIGGENWSNVDSLATLPMPVDPYVVPTFHYYQPYVFTHQGESWLPNGPKLGRGYGSSADKALLDSDLAAVRAYMARTGRVPVLGEYGATDNSAVPAVQRIRYYHTISSAFASIGVSSCAWGYRSGFKLRHGDHWIPGLVESIAAPTAVK
jgi:endoglucanase